MSWLGFKQVVCLSTRTKFVPKFVTICDNLCNLWLKKRLHAAGEELNFHKTIPINNRIAMNHQAILIRFGAAILNTFLAKNRYLYFLLFGITSFASSATATAQTGFEHRGYLGWMVDFSRTPIVDKWPSIQLDSSIMADYLETLDFLQRTGMNEITPWGLFTDENWDPDIAKTLDADRKKLVVEVIKAAHQRNIKVMCGMGIYSWGFGKIISQNPELACPTNPNVMDLSKPQAWEWQKKVLDYVMDNFEFEGISMQSGDKGWCQCGDYAKVSSMQYHALLNQKAVEYIRSKKPSYIIGISGWGMDMSNPQDSTAIFEMTRKVDYLIDVGETLGFAGTPYRRKLIHKIAPCAYGSTAIPNIEPIQAVKRDLYFIPTTFATGNQLQQIYAEGGRACEAYARTRGNAGDKVTIEVVARLLKNPRADIKMLLKNVLKEIYAPKNKQALNELTEVFIQAERAFFENIPAFGQNNQYDKVILLLPREQIKSSIEYFNRMSSGSRVKYAETLKILLRQSLGLKQHLKNQAATELLINSIRNTIAEAEKR